MVHRFALTCALVLLSLPTLFAQAQGDADTKEILSYRLTLDNLKQFAAATLQMVDAAKTDPRYREVAKLQAELDALEEKDERTEAEEARVEKLTAQIEDLESKMPNAGINASEAKSLSDMEAAMRKEPLMMSALNSAGMTPRDYAKFTLAFFQAAMVHGMQKQGLVKEIPKELQATVNMENIKFVEANQAEISKLMAEVQAASKK